jgi:Rad3-related DNA helicase
LKGDQNGGFNAMLESPTGTGKTICLISACVAFMKAEREKQKLK